MKKVYLFLCIALTAFAVQVQAAVDKPIIHKLAFSDNCIGMAMSNNGEWVVAHASNSADRDKSLARLIQVSTGEELVIHGTKELQENGPVSVNDVTDAGDIVVGSFRGQPAYWSKSTSSWTVLPFPESAKYSYGEVYAVTPDGHYAVGVYGDGEYHEAPLLWDLTKNETVETPNLPTKNMLGEDVTLGTSGKAGDDFDIRLQRFTGISADGRYILVMMSWTPVQPIGSCYFVYDRQTEQASCIGFNPEKTIVNASTNDPSWEPTVPGLILLQEPWFSSKGDYVTLKATMAYESDWSDQHNAIIVYNVATKETTVLNNEVDRETRADMVGNDGTMYGSTPFSGTPIREWGVRSEGYWYSLPSILSQVYGIDFYNKTGYSNSGTPFCTSDDETKILVMVDPSLNSYVLELPEPLKNVCSGINLLTNYNVTPAYGSQFSKLKDFSITFERNVDVIDDEADIVLKDKDGNEKAHVSKISVSTANPKTVDFQFFRTQTLEKNMVYTIEIPAGVISVAGDANKANDVITLKYVGRDDKALAVLDVYPQNDSELAKIDNATNPVLIAFDAEVKLSEDEPKAKLVRVENGEDVLVSPMFMMKDGNRVGLYPSNVQYLFLGQQYKVILEAGAVTDISGAGANEEYVINYTGTFERTINYSDEQLFKEDFNDLAASATSVMRYDGDHLNPTAAMKKWEFDKDNMPWNLSIRDNEKSLDFCAGSHSMYDPAGQSDDWMVIPQLAIPDEYCQMTFDAQSYLKSKNDYLKVLIWENDQVIQVLNEATISQLKAEGKVVFNEKLNPGISQEELDDDWTHYVIDLAEYAGKNIYIAFYNDNTDQSAMFVDNISVKRNMKYMFAVTSEEAVVGKNSAPVTGKVTINSDIDTYSSITLTLNDSEGNELSRISESGLTMAKGYVYPFAFDNELPLVSGAVNTYTVGIELDDYKDVIKGSIKALMFEPTKRVVLEETTGVNCGNCPQGIIAIEHMEKLFGHNFIPVSIHAYPGDPFGSAFTDYSSSFLGHPGAPMATINRGDVISSPMFVNPYTFRYEMSNGKDLWLDLVNAEFEKLCEADIEAEVIVNEEDKTFDIPVTVTYALNAKSLSLNLFVILMEDGIESTQSNYMSKSSDPIFGDWGKGGKYGYEENYGVTHNDVVRAIYGASYNGTSGLLPQAMNAGEQYTKTLTDLRMPDDLRKLEKAKVVVMMIDANTDKVVNSVCTLFPQYAAGVSNVSADALCTVSAYGHNVVATATGAMEMSVYTPSGVLIGTAKGTDNANVTIDGYAGSVLVKVTSANGVTTKKVVID